MKLKIIGIRLLKGNEVLNENRSRISLYPAETELSVIYRRDQIRKILQRFKDFLGESFIYPATVDRVS